MKYLTTSTTHYGSVSGGSTFIVLPKGSKPGSGLKSYSKALDRFANNRHGRKRSSSGNGNSALTGCAFNSRLRAGALGQAINTKLAGFASVD
jgi:hypothetical protein